MVRERLTNFWKPPKGEKIKIKVLSPMEDEPKIDTTFYNEIIRINPKLLSPEHKLLFNLKQLMFLIMTDWTIDQIDKMIYKRDNRWQEAYTDTSLRLPK